jgi:hypothetical protein
VEQEEVIKLLDQMLRQILVLVEEVVVSLLDLDLYSLEVQVVMVSS